MLNKNQKLEAIRAACIAANPEIVELKFGCLGKEKNTDRVWIKTHQGWQGVDHTSNWSITPPDIIIGRDIHLADILAAMEKSRSQIQHAKIVMILCNAWGEQQRWNLLKPLEEQEEQTISFLHEILCEK